MSSSDPVSVPAADVAGAAPRRWRIGADWAAVIIAAVIIVAAVVGLLPSIPFLVK